MVPMFLEQRQTGVITITDPRMTRFWITLQQGVEFVIQCLEMMQGGEIFVPKIPSMNIMDLAQAIAPDCQIKYIGIRPGEKLHEALISEDEARHTVELEKMYVIQPLHPWWQMVDWPQAQALPEGFCYTSDTNTDWLSVKALQQLIQ